MSQDPPPLYELAQASTLGVRTPALLLSAGVPRARTDAHTTQQQQQGSRYLPARRTEIRTAVVQLARFAFVRDVQLVFGGHPAISPLVLQATRAVASSDEPRVFVFQSAYFHQVIPDDTERLAHWSHARLLWTRSDGPPQEPDHPGDPAARTRSLQIMREAMLDLPGLVGAVFIGGMDGVEDEARLWQQRWPQRPCYALPETGGAARRLFDSDPSGFAGTLPDPAVLDTRVFPRALAELFADLLG